MHRIGRTTGRADATAVAFITPSGSSQPKEKLKF
jgi:hypothetical protein